LASGKATPASVAAAESLSPKYLTVLWQTLSGPEADPGPLAGIRARWKGAKPGDVGTLAGEIRAWQDRLWKIQPIGSYRYGNVVRQVANDSLLAETQTLRVPLKSVS